MARITNNGKTVIAQKQADGEPLIIDRFIWAYIEGLDHTQPVDPNEQLPTIEQIKNDEAPTQIGFVNPDLVVYSSVLGTTIGNFKFNWIGLALGDDLIAANYLPDQYKIKTDTDKLGNTLNKNFAIQFKDAVDTTGVTISAETWQIDYTASFSAIDERERLSNFDLYGRQTFINDGFNVVKSGSDYIVNSGMGYIAGLRCDLASNHTLADIGSLPKNIFIDVVLNGGITGKHIDFDFVVSSIEKNDYVDNAGQKHFVEKIAVIESGGLVTDKRIVLDKTESSFVNRFLRKSSETLFGITREATESEVNLGLLSSIFVSPIKLKKWLENRLTDTKFPPKTHEHNASEIKDLPPAWYPGDLKPCAAPLNENELEKGWKFANGVGTYVRNGRTFNVPNLLDKFIVAGGSEKYPLGSTGGSLTSTTSSNGEFQPVVTVNNTTLTVETTATHDHDVPNSIYDGSPYKLPDVGGTSENVLSKTKKTGGSKPHSHSSSITKTPNHTHTSKVEPPFYALAFLIYIGV